MRLRIRVETHKTFSLDGHDLTVKVPITSWEAALGATIKVDTLDGKVSLKVPAGIQGGQKLRLKQKGLPRKGGARGDLYVRVWIAIPSGDKLTDNERTLFESLSQVSDFEPRS